MPTNGRYSLAPGKTPSWQAWLSGAGGSFKQMWCCGLQQRSRRSGAGTYDIVGTIINDPPKNYFCRELFLPNFFYYRFNHFRRPEVMGYFRWLTKGYETPLWDQQAARLDEIRQWCRDNKSELVVAIFPFLADLSPDYAFERSHHVLSEYWTKNKIPVLDLLSVYRAHLGQSLVVNRYDAHPNERAHAIAAAAIWDGLLSDRLTDLSKRTP